MKTQSNTIMLMLVLNLIAAANAAVLFEDNFDGVGDGGGAGSFTNAWVVEGTLYGGAGTESAPQAPTAPSTPNWAFFQTNASNSSAIYIDTGIAAVENSAYNLSYYRGGRTDGQHHTGVFTAELWAGDPTAGGMLIDSANASSAAPGTVVLNSHTFNSATGVSGNLYLRFNAGTSGSGSFEQPLLDSITLSQDGGSSTNPTMPIPQDGAVKTECDIKLEWTGHPQAVSYDVLFGINPSGLTLVDNVSEPNYAITNLRSGVTYNWRIDTHGSAGETWTGDIIWEFTTKGMSAHWPIDEGTGAAISDMIGGIVGTFQNGPSWQTGITGQAVYLDGINDYVELPPLNLNSNSLTISAWIKPDGPQNDWAGIFFSRAGSTTAGLSLAPGNELRYHWDDTGWSWSSGIYVPENTWAFVAFVIEPGSVTLYLEAEGENYAKTRSGSYPPEAFDGVTLLGRDSYGSERSFKGTIDEVKIYDYALSPHEVLAIPGDVDVDGAVNTSDLIEMCQSWLDSTDPSLYSLHSDINNDSKVDGSDFSFIGKHWRRERVWEDPIKQYILTPPPSPLPRINGAKIFGVRPGKPFLFKVAATGTRPLTYEAANLPAGLSIDAQTGIITGTAPSVKDTYVVNLTVTNALGQAQRDLRIKVGDVICLTPPMSWNSWYIWSESISEQKMRDAAQAMVDSGLVDHGWTYINMDDCWQAERGGPYNAIQPNSRFPDINGMVDFIHSLGLKAGLYSTPWQGSYAGFIGGSSPTASGDYSAYYLPEAQRLQPTQFFGRYPGIHSTGLDGVGPYWFNDEDVQQWCDWGFDMVKMDWNPNDIPTTTRIYNDFQAASRDLVFSLSNTTPFQNITEIASMCNLWRTTGDIHDSWSSMSSKGFGVEPWRPYSGPGHWNDQDMLQVGVLGRTNWFTTEANLRPTNLTPDEQYTQVSLWSLTCSPLILSCDLTKLDDFTINLLTNDEVIEVNQDPLGQQAARVRDDGDLEVWAKDMEDGSKAVGLFNRSTSQATVSVNWSDLGITGLQVVRDLWRQQDLGTYDGSFQAEVNGHGVVLVNIRPGL